jgi:hypothetical protein
MCPKCLFISLHFQQKKKQAGPIRNCTVKIREYVFIALNFSFGVIPRR